MMTVLVTVVLVLLAYLAGLVTLRVKSRWCSQCGSVKSCPRCAAWAATTLPGAATIEWPRTPRRRRRAR